MENEETKSEMLSSIDDTYTNNLSFLQLPKQTESLIKQALIEAYQHGIIFEMERQKGFFETELITKKQTNGNKTKNTGGCQNRSNAIGTVRISGATEFRH